MKSNIQTLFARILEEIRAEMDDAETLYLKLCQNVMSCMVRQSEADSVSSGRKIEHLSAQYREMLLSIIRDVSTVYRNPIQVFPVSDRASLLDTLEAYNAQFEELERIINQLCKENSVPLPDQSTK